MTKGGKRAGAGRPLAEPVEIVRLRLPKTEFDKVQALGGTLWVRRVVREALFKAAQVEITFPAD